MEGSIGANEPPEAVSNAVGVGPPGSQQDAQNAGNAKDDDFSGAAASGAVKLGFSGEPGKLGCPNNLGGPGPTSSPSWRGGQM